ncbi:MAG: hypothetical protein IJT04_07555 [Bacteroidales bacterium]|nr:hypothetical protein [Bacteroidales bacterium]
MILKIEVNQPLLFAKSTHNRKTKDHHRCRGHQGTKAAVKDHGSGFRCPIT